MKHDLKIRRRGFWHALETACRSLNRWRNEREAQRSLAGIVRRKSGHLLDDVGLSGMDADCRSDPVRGYERHRFWML